MMATTGWIDLCVWPSFLQAVFQFSQSVFGPLIDSSLINDHFSPSWDSQKCNCLLVFTSLFHSLMQKSPSFSLYSTLFLLTTFNINYSVSRSCLPRHCQCSGFLVVPMCLSYQILKDRFYFVLLCLHLSSELCVCISFFLLSVIATAFLCQTAASAAARFLVNAANYLLSSSSDCDCVSQSDLFSTFSLFSLSLV